MDGEPTRLFTHEMAARNDDVNKAAEDKHTLDVAKKEVYTDVLASQESKLQEFTADLPSESVRKN